MNSLAISPTTAIEKRKNLFVVSLQFNKVLRRNAKMRVRQRCRATFDFFSHSTSKIYGMATSGYGWIGRSRYGYRGLRVVTLRLDRDVKVSGMEVYGCFSMGKVRTVWLGMLQYR